MVQVIDAVMDLLREMGYDEDWVAQQPEPTSDCPAEYDHYASLLTFSRCPYCDQEEVSLP